MQKKSAAIRERQVGVSDNAVSPDSSLAERRAELDDAKALNEALRRTNAELERSRAALRDSEARYKLILESATGYAVLTTNLDGRITSWNTGARNLLGWEEVEALGRPSSILYTPEDQAAGVPQAEMRDAQADGRAADERWHTRKDGTRFWASGLMMPLRPEGGGVQGFLKMLRDRTDQRRAEEAARQANAEKDLLMMEVHHRVKNSLQMVQALLNLQARAAGDETAAVQLEESAARVSTIAAIHDQLYRTGAGLDVQVGTYLRNLADSLGQGLASMAAGRVIRLDADNPIWPAAGATTLGLVTVELVTNALKYGQGSVLIHFRQDPDAASATLRVSDEGAGIPAGFDPARSPGLGMRMITGLIRSGGGTFDVESGPGGGFAVTLPVPKLRLSWPEPATA